MNPIEIFYNGIACKCEWEEEEKAYIGLYDDKDGRFCIEVVGKNEKELREDLEAGLRLLFEDD